MYSVETFFGRIPDHLPPAVSHVSRPCRVVDAEIILFHFGTGKLINLIRASAADVNRPFATCEVNSAVARVDGQGTANSPIAIAEAEFTSLEHEAEIGSLSRLDVEAKGTA